MQTDCDVLIAGSGPTGVTLAILLARRGVRVIVVEKEPDIYPLPRAAHIDHEAMRILQEAGVAEAVMATSRRTARYDFLSAKGELLLSFDGADRMGAGGWPASSMIHQPSVERALRDALSGHAGAELRSGCELVRFGEQEDGIVATLDCGGTEQTVRARYLIGADGARSPVRHACGIAFDDLGFEEPWLVVDVLVDDYARLPGANLQICDPARPTTCVLMGEGRHRWEFMLLPGETAEDMASDAAIAGLLAPWDVEGAVRLERKAVYTFRARVAERWRQGRVLLAGDAAHQTPPFAGQGMCSGLRDAVNLAWKLAAVVAGGNDALLDSYQPEREPHLRATIQMAIMMGRTVCVTDPEAAAARDAQMLAARVGGAAPDGAIAYPPIVEGLILAGTAGAGSYFPQPVSADGDRLDDALGCGAMLIDSELLESDVMKPFAGQLHAWLTRHAVPALLLRPDGHVFGTGEPDDLRRSWHAVTGLVA